MKNEIELTKEDLKRFVLMLDGVELIWIKEIVEKEFNKQFSPIKEQPKQKKLKKEKR